MYQSVDGRQKGKSCSSTFYLFHSYFFLSLILVIEFIAFFLSFNFARGRLYIIFSRLLGTFADEPWTNFLVSSFF